MPLHFLRRFRIAPGLRRESQQVGREPICWPLRRVVHRRPARPPCDGRIAGNGAVLDRAFGTRERGHRPYKLAARLV